MTTDFCFGVEQIFEGSQFGIVKFALNQLINGVYVRVLCFNFGTDAHLFCKVNSVTLMKCFNFSFHSHLLAHFEFGLMSLIATLK